jgi:hypothetical protein
MNVSTATYQARYPALMHPAQYLPINIEQANAPDMEAFWQIAYYLAKVQVLPSTFCVQQPCSNPDEYTEMLRKLPRIEYASLQVFCKL